MKRKINVIVTIFIVTTVVGIFKAFAEESEIEESRKFIEGYGWQISEKYTDLAKIKIPEIFDEVYKSYNVVQNEAGLNIEPYRGMDGARYTFEVINYPIDVGEKVFANVICIKGKPVAGDIMTISVNGFMHSLRMPE